MQHNYKSIALPLSEYARLQRLMLTMIGSRTVLASILRRKLGSAAPVSPSAGADPDGAYSGRRVHFRVDGQHPEERVLTWKPLKRADNVNLSLLSPRGLALLGLRPGESISYSTEGGRSEYLEVERVSDRPLTSAARGVKRIEVPHLSNILGGHPIDALASETAGGSNA